MMTKILTLSVLLLASASALCAADEKTILCARDFGVVGDGVADDGPAVQRMLQAGENKSGVSFVFETNRVYRIKTAAASSPWIFTWTNHSDIAFDGGGSVFLLDPSMRFMNVSRCNRVTIRNVKLDYDPLPFVEGTVVGKNQTDKTLDVSVGEGFAMPPLGGPTREREQSYFGMLWMKDIYGRDISAHLSVEDITEGAPGSLKDRTVRVYYGKTGLQSQAFYAIKTGKTPVTLPVRGVAHKMVDAPNGHATIVLDENHDLTFEDVSIWSAPLFAVLVSSNEGTCTFRRFNIVPKPNSGRMTSSWRDGFHVKGNRARLLWEDCQLDGMHDDAFNISTHAARVEKVVSDTEWIIRQIFPLNVMDYRPGDSVLVADDVRGAVLGRATVVEGGMPPVNEQGRAQSLKIKLDQPITGVEKGCRLWNETSANPGAVLRRCKVSMSCRLQSSGILIESCEFNALVWFYGEHVEGPMPIFITAKDSRFASGRGNPKRAVVLTGRLQGNAGPAPAPAKAIIESASFVKCEFTGEVVCEDIGTMDFTGSEFLPPRGRLIETRCGKITGTYVGE